MDTLQSQLNYWQNVTINILKDLYLGIGYVHISHLLKELCIIQVGMVGIM